VAQFNQLVNKDAYQMMISYFKGTADAVAEYCTAVVVQMPLTPFSALITLEPHKHLSYQLTPVGPG